MNSTYIFIGAVLMLAFIAAGGVLAVKNLLRPCIIIYRMHGSKAIWFLPMILLPLTKFVYSLLFLCNNAEDSEDSILSLLCLMAFGLVFMVMTLVQGGLIGEFWERASKSLSERKKMNWHVWRDCFLPVAFPETGMLVFCIIDLLSS